MKITMLFGTGPAQVLGTEWRATPEGSSQAALGIALWATQHQSDRGRASIPTLHRTFSLQVLSRLTLHNV